MKIYLGTIPATALKVRSQKSYYAQQKKLFILLIIAASVIPLVIISWTSSYVHKRTWREQTIVSLTGLADSRRDLIDRMLGHQEDILVVVTSLRQPRQLAADRQDLERVFTAVNRNGEASGLSIVDGRGTLLASVGQGRQGMEIDGLEAQAWFAEVMRNGRYAGAISADAEKGPRFLVAIAAADRSWAITVTLDPERLYALLREGETGPTEHVFIINREGMLLTPLEDAAPPLSREEMKRLASAAPGAHALGDSLFITSGLNSGQWLLVLEADLKQSLSWFYQARNRDWLIISLASLVILGVASLTIRSMVSKIEKADSERMIMTDRVRQAEKMALIGRLSASVAHEINNPLQIIADLAGWMEELLDDDPEEQARTSAEYRSSIEKIRAQVKRASSITHRLLGFCRKESGRATVDLNNLVEESISILENEAKKHRIVIRRNLASGLPPLVSDASQLQQVFLNILDNAIDAIGDDGIVTVTTDMADGQATIEFADTGPGLSKEELSKIFDPFFTTKTSAQGTGLGLWISYNIMQCLRGDIKARNGSIGGSVFRVILPMRQDQTAYIPESRQTEHSQVNRNGSDKDPRN